MLTPPGRTRADDGVMLVNRSSSGDLIADPAKFTNGSLAALGDYLHARKLKLGVYSSGGTGTCMGRAGSYGHEAQDAATWARWGVDYAKLDWCNSKEPVSSRLSLRPFASVRPR